MQAERVVRSNAPGGEGPVWDARTKQLVWLDITSRILNRYDPVTGRNTEESLPVWVSCVVPVDDADFLAATENGISRLVKNDAGVWTCSLCMETDTRPEMVSNDGRCDSHGRFAVGMMEKNCKKGAGAFYLCDPQRGVTCFETGLTIPNGMDWSPDERILYATDSPQNCIFAYAYDPEQGRVGKRRVFAETRCADGLTVDAEGNVWAALCSSGKVVCLEGGSGRVLREIEFPMPYITSCAIGGDNNELLFATSANWGRADILAAYPDAGSLYCVRI